MEIHNYDLAATMDAIRAVRDAADALGRAEATIAKMVGVNYNQWTSWVSGTSHSNYANSIRICAACDHLVRKGLPKRKKHQARARA